MTNLRKIWLVTNEASGSNDDAGVGQVLQACRRSGMTIAGRSTFPADPLPTPDVLAEADIHVLAIFAGDGTVNAVLQAMAGWRGQVLVLPGGTMNLLFHRLFGDLALEQVIERVGADDVLSVRPAIIEGPPGTAFAEVMAGPGTTWSSVREAMRDGNLLAMAAEATTAVAQTLGGDMIACIDPPLGRPEGYPLLTIRAGGDGLSLIAYYAETAGEMLEQASAMAARDFRRGPHEVLGIGQAFTVHAPAADGFGVLLDGEQEFAPGPVRFSLARCKVDLLATLPDG